MKKIILLSSVFILFLSAFTKSDFTPLPSANLKKLDGSVVNANTFSNGGKPLIISFWATWCVPCKKELDAISKNYTEWQKETGVKLIAISIDDARSVSKLEPMVKAKGWPYEVYSDEALELKKAMNVTNVPHTVILDGNGKIVWTHNSYTEGDEAILFENVKKVIKGEVIEH